MPQVKYKGTHSFHQSLCALRGELICDPASRTSTVYLRVEANSSTLWEGPIRSGPRNITVSHYSDYPSHRCDGRPTGNEPYPPGNTALDALDEASKIRGFTYDGAYFGDPSYDFDITRIGSSSLDPGNDNPGNDKQPNTYYWGFLINYQLSPSLHSLLNAACHDILKPGDEVLWAYITIAEDSNIEIAPGVSFLKLTPPVAKVEKGKGITVTVTDGRSGNKTQGASVAGVKTNADGKATLYFSKPGLYQYKAHRTGDVRSNVIDITVTN